MRKTKLIQIITFTLTIIMGIIGCSNDDRILQPATFPTDPNVFTDEFGSNVTFQAFAGSDVYALDLDQVTTYSGSQSLQVVIPDVGDPDGSYAGGAFTTTNARDLTGYNALTFYAKANTTATLDVVGIGNNNLGTSKFTAEVKNLALTTSWQKYIIPIPLADKLLGEEGLFYFAEGPEDGSGYLLWFDEIIFDSLASVTNPRPTLSSPEIDVEIDEIITIGNQIVTFDVGGSDIDVEAMPNYFTFESSNANVVSVDSTGTITATGLGTATLTATLGTVSATGSITVNVNPLEAVPTTSAPAPTALETDVISIFSNVYTNETVDTWLTDWSVGDVNDYMIGSDDIKKYENLEFAGIEFATSTLDISDMTRFHMDIWTPNSTQSPSKFEVKLVDFGADGVFGGSNDVEHLLSFDEYSSPAIATGSWISIDVPLVAFTDLLTKEHLSQLIISGDLSTVYVDNIYFYDAGPLTAPLIPAATPYKDQSDVISLFSDAYTDVAIDTWSATWDLADVADFAIDSDNIKKYTNVLVAGIEFKTSTINASAMTHFHMDVWTPDATASPSVFKIKLVDFGANGVYDDEGNDDVAHEITLDENTMNTGIWIGIDISLADFTGLTTVEHIGQLIISGTPNTVFVDNIYLYDSGIPNYPTEAAPTPTVDADSVISLFSDAYTNVTVDTWSTVWDTADVADYIIGSDNVKKYTNLLFAGIEFTTNTIDASTMTHFHMDVWTPNATNSPAVFKIKLVDFGADGAWQGGDDVEHEITLDENTMNTGSWVGIEVPLTDFTDLTTKGHVAQLIISGDPNTVFVDNVYFHK